MKLTDIQSPSQLKTLSEQELKALAEDIREEIIRTVSVNGGHLASNLGAVELTIALHRVFDCPRDQLVFDVGHQCYTHKILTGRAERFHTLRQLDEEHMEAIFSEVVPPEGVGLAVMNRLGRAAAFRTVQAEQILADHK